MSPDNLPLELQYKIISKMDIDSRRALNIYTKLRPPKQIADLLTKSLANRPKQTGNDLALTLTLSKTKTYMFVKCIIEGEYIDFRFVHEIRKHNTFLAFYKMIWTIIDD